MKLNPRKLGEKAVGILILLVISASLGVLFGTPPAVAAPTSTQVAPVVTRADFAQDPYWFQGCINPMGSRMNYVSADLVFTGKDPAVLKLFHQDSKGDWVPVTSKDQRVMVNGHEVLPSTPGINEITIQLVGTMGFWERRQPVSIMVWGVQPNEQFSLYAQFNDSDNNPLTNNPITSLMQWSAKSQDGCAATVR